MLVWGQVVLLSLVDLDETGDGGLELGVFQVGFYVENLVHKLLFC